MFSAGYRLSAPNDFRSTHILDKRGIRDRIGMRDRKGNRILDMMGMKTCRGSKARSANFVNASVDSSMDEPLRNMSMMIKPPTHVSTGTTEILPG
jgi:hypothetical protein